MLPIFLFFFKTALAALLPFHTNFRIILSPCRNISLRIMFDVYIDLQTAVLSVLNFLIHEPSMSVRLLRTSLIFFHQHVHSQHASLWQNVLC